MLACTRSGLTAEMICSTTAQQTASDLPAGVHLELQRLMFR